MNAASVPHTPRSINSAPEQALITHRGEYHFPSRGKIQGIMHKIGMKGSRECVMCGSRDEIGHVTVCPERAINEQGRRRPVCRARVSAHKAAAEAQVEFADRLAFACGQPRPNSGEAAAIQRAQISRECSTRLLRSASARTRRPITLASGEAL